LFQKVRLFQAGEEPVLLDVRVEDGRVLGLGSGLAPGDSEVISGQSRLLTPGLIDVHTHGIERFVFESGPDDLREGLAVLPRYGTTALCPTLYRVMAPERLKELEALAAVLDEELPVRVPGFHLEGPFLRLPGAGALGLDGDVGLLREILAAAPGKVSIMSISPDTPGIIPVIEHLRAHGVLPFVTHTAATYEETIAAIDAGALHATHFYDVFPPPPETDAGVRPVGAVEAILADPRCTVDFIADGIHVHPGAIQLALRCKGPGGVILITDSNRGAGLEEGEYDTPWGFRIQVSPGRGVRIADPEHPLAGGLAGSALTMDQGMRNLHEWLDLPEGQVWELGTLNPARLLGLETEIGRIAPGMKADLVLWEGERGQVRVCRTWVDGHPVWTDERFVP